MAEIMMYCPECGDEVEPEDLKGDGVYFEWHCQSCGLFVKRKPALTFVFKEELT